MRGEEWWNAGCTCPLSAETTGEFTWDCIWWDGDSNRYWEVRVGPDGTAYTYAPSLVVLTIEELP